MDKHKFIDAIKEVVIEDSIISINSNLTQPPGRSPAKNLLELSNWFNNQTVEDQVMVMKIVKESVETGVFGFLCVIDGVRAIEDNKEKGNLTLTYKKDGNVFLLNNGDEYLHDLL